MWGRREGGVSVPFTDEVRKMKSKMVTARARWLLS